jgi:molybdopterin-biosynthesis enzyme MoeA-like protein
MSVMREFAVIIIGDEILSGKRRDGHLVKAIEILGKRGLTLAQAEYVGDDPARITALLKRSFARDAVVFSFGGIGATPDDHTRQCAAAALGVPIAEHPEAIAAMAAKPDFELTANRRKMAEFPTGARIVPNPYNQIAAFSCGPNFDHHFLPGFPEMAWPMMEWVLETHYKSAFHSQVIASESIIIHDAGESTLIDMMNALLARYSAIKLSSLPQHIPGGRLIELTLSGDPAQVPMAMAEARAEVTRLGFRFTNK